MKKAIEIGDIVQWSYNAFPDNPEKEYILIIDTRTELGYPNGCWKGIVLYTPYNSRYSKSDWIFNDGNSASWRVVG